MRCLKCFNEDLKKQPKKLKLPNMLSHLANYTICSDCDDRVSNYRLRSQYYKDIQEKYRKDLADQYINRLIADNSSLKPNDIPKELTNAKRQYLKTKKMLKEA